MKKRVLILLVLIAVLIVACSEKKADNSSTANNGDTTTTVQAQNTGDIAVDSIGKDIDNAASTDDDLSGSGLGDLDSGLADIQNI